MDPNAITTCTAEEWQAVQSAIASIEDAQAWIKRSPLELHRLTEELDDLKESLQLWSDAQDD